MKLTPEACNIKPNVRQSIAVGIKLYCFLNDGKSIFIETRQLTTCYGSMIFNRFIYRMSLSSANETQTSQTNI